MLTGDQFVFPFAQNAAVFTGNPRIVLVVDKILRFPRVVLHVEEQGVGIFGVLGSVAGDKLRMAAVGLSNKGLFKIARVYVFHCIFVLARANDSTGDLPIGVDFVAPLAGTSAFPVDHRTETETALVRRRSNASVVAQRE